MNNPIKYPEGIDPQTGEPFIDRNSKLFKMSHLQRTNLLWADHHLKGWGTQELSKHFGVTCHVVDVYIQMHNLHPSLLLMTDENLKGWKKLSFFVAFKIAQIEVNHQVHLCNAVLNLAVEDAISKIDEMIKINDMRFGAKLYILPSGKIKTPCMVKNCKKIDQERKSQPVMKNESVVTSQIIPKKIVFVDPLVRAKKVAEKIFGKNGEKTLIKPNLDQILGDSGKAEKTI